MFFFNGRLFLWGLGIWLGGTVALRAAGQRFLHRDEWKQTPLLFVVSFLAMAWLGRRLCRRVHLPREQWPAGAILVALPTLVLDSFSSAFFKVAFPNIPPQTAGLFGGWMLCCSAGALLGALVPP
jgi:hypothetical protein